MQESAPEQITTALSCRMKELLPDKAEQLWDPWQFMVLLERGSAMGQRSHMQSWGLEGIGPSRMEQSKAEVEDGGHELANGDPDVKRVLKLVRPSNTPTGKLVRAKFQLRSRYVRLVRPSNTPTGKLVRAKFQLSSRDVRLVRPSNTPTGKLVRASL